MKHLSEEQLIAHFYGDDDEHGAAEHHLNGCAGCTEEYDRLRATLALVSADPVPEPGAEYAADVWARIAPALVREETKPEQSFWARLLNPPRWAWAATAALLVAAAFIAGMLVPREPTAGPAVVDKGDAPSPQIRERVLLVALGEHLDRSQMLLVELANAEPGAKLDISREQVSAESLVDDNRLYRQAAHQVGDARVGEVLDELERVLVEIANSSPEMSAPQLEALQQRIQAQGLIFKVRVVGSQARKPRKTAAPAAEEVKL